MGFGSWDNIFVPITLPSPLWNECIFKLETCNFLSNLHPVAWMASAWWEVVGRAGRGRPDAAELAGWVGYAFEGKPSLTLRLVIIFVWISMLESPGS